jgi:hypothetical protein
VTLPAKSIPQVAAFSDRLIAEGAIYAPRHGWVEFATPHSRPIRSQRASHPALSGRFRRAGTPVSPPLLGAKLGAILCGRWWTAVDAGGLETVVFRTCVDGCGRVWTGFVHLRIRRLGVRVPPGVLLLLRFQRFLDSGQVLAMTGFLDDCQVISTAVSREPFSDGDRVLMPLATPPCPYGAPRSLDSHPDPAVLLGGSSHRILPDRPRVRRSSPRLSDADMSNSTESAPGRRTRKCATSEVGRRLCSMAGTIVASCF